MKREEKKWYAPERIFEEYEKGVSFKTSLSERGMYAQNRMNERFFVGDQWYGAVCGDERPLVRHNIIKRIGDYKMAVIDSSSLAVNYSADGVPNTKEIRERVRKQRDKLRTLENRDGMLKEMETLSETERINLIMGAMNDYYRVTAERVKMDDLKNIVLKNAYIGGTGILYTYWDPMLKTGMYADEGRTSPIEGDIRCEVLDIENVYFGDPNLDNVQEQPYILIAQRRSVKELRREAKRNGARNDAIDSIRADQDTANEAGDRSQKEPTDADKTVAITKLYKEWDDDGRNFTIKAVTVVKGATIRQPWDIGIKLYPIAKLSWETRRNCIYGESEITHLIPNQIAVNRALTAEISSVMSSGMPIMLVNGDKVEGEITNDPGQIIRVYGDNITDAVAYVSAKGFQAQFDNLVNNLIGNTMTQSGANEAALGDMKPENTSALIAVREAATRPMQLLQNRFQSFIEDNARIWAEMWIKMYGTRCLKVEDENGEWYLPFNGEDYAELMITARIDVGANSLWSELQSVKTLDNLFERNVIDVEQYLERLPKGSVPQLGRLLREVQEKKATENVPVPTPTPAEQNPVENGGILAGVAAAMPENYKRAYEAMPPEVRQQVAQKMAERSGRI